MLTIYAPFNNPNSKAWEVFNGVEKSWPDQITKLDNYVMVLARRALGGRGAGASEH